VLDQVLQVLVRRHQLVQGSVPGPARLRRPVANDPVQPSAQVLDLGAGAQRRVSIQQRLLHDVLAPALGVEAARVGDQLRPVALDYLRERPVVAGPGQGDQPLIGLRTEE
jgi:hypothetical protein